MLAARKDVFLIDLSYGQYTWSRGIRIIKKMVRVLAAIPKLLFRLRRNVGVLYMPLDARWGLYYSLLFVLLARLRGYRIVAHHHVYNYIDKYYRRIAIINRLIGTEGAHVVHCEQMKADYLRTYPMAATFLMLPPTVVLQTPTSDNPRKRNRALTIGFLSNLTPEKGVEEALETFEMLAESGRDIRMIIAGPVILKQKQMEQKIRDASTRWPGKLDYRGAVYGSEKSRYFTDIDVFLLPSHHESWGIVLEEALNAGCPVIANRRGCIPWIIRDGCGIIVQPWQRFSDVAVKQIHEWLDGHEKFLIARQNALERAKTLREEADHEASVFLEAMLTF